MNYSISVDYIKHDLGRKFYFKNCGEDVYTSKTLKSLYQALFDLWNEKIFILAPFKIFRQNIMLAADIGCNKIYAKYMCKLHEMGLIWYSNYKNEAGKISREGVLCTVQMRPLDKIYEKWWQEVREVERTEKDIPLFPTQFEPMMPTKNNAPVRPNNTQQSATKSHEDKKPEKTEPTATDLQVMAAEKNKQLTEFYASEILDRINMERTTMGIETPVIPNEKETKACEALLSVITNDGDLNESEKMKDSIIAAISTWVSNAVGNEFWIRKFSPSSINSNIQHFSMKLKKQGGVMVSEKGIPLSDGKGNMFPRNVDELQRLYKEKYQKNTNENKEDKTLILRFMKEEIGFYFDEKLKRLMRPKTTQN